MIFSTLLLIILVVCICGIAYAWSVRPKQEPSPFTDIRVEPIKNVKGWSSVNVKINNRQYRLDMENEVANEFGKRLQ